MMEKEVVNVFINDTKKDMNELFDRVRKLEVHQAVSSERDKTLIDKMNELSEFFKKHDEAEMAKYTSIEEEVGKLTKVLYMGAGILSLLYFVGFEGLAALLGG